MSLDEVSSGERWEEMNRFGVSIVALTGLVDRLDGVEEEREWLQGFCWNNWVATGAACCLHVPFTG